MVFKRQLSYYIVTIYVPTFMIVCVSWMSFWLDHKSAPARVALTGAGVGRRVRKSLRPSGELFET
jgi:hypothetical protein